MAKLKKEDWGWVWLLCLWTGMVLAGGSAVVGWTTICSALYPRAEDLATATPVEGASGEAAGSVWGAKPTRYFEDLTDVTLVEVHDGDTLVVDLPKEKKLFGYHRLVRISGIDTPELRDPRPDIRLLAQQAKDLVVTTLAAAKKVTLRKTTQDDKYGRILCEVWADGLNLGPLLLEAGLAKPYGGGSKERLW